MSVKKKVAFLTLGCRTNQFDTESMNSQFKAKNYLRTDEPAQADILVVNTCTVTNKADSKSRQMVRKYLKAPGQRRVIVTGCSSHYDPTAFSRMKGVSLVLGNLEKNDILSYLDRDEKIIRRPVHEEKILPNLPIENFGSKTRANIKVQDGCDHFCSFCIIPFVRGRSRSKDYYNVLEQFEVLLEHGYKELVLTGIHIGQYYDKKHDKNLFDLARRLLESHGDFRIRFGSLEPGELTEAMADYLSGHKKVCQFLHLPIQSGSPEIFESMRRPSHLDHFEKICRRLRTANPYFSIGTDIITGFPGETETDFDKTYEKLVRNDITFGHIFPYSPKKETRSIKMKNLVPNAIKNERASILRSHFAREWLRQGTRFLEKDVLVLPESISENGMAEGFSGEYFKVKFPLTGNQNSFYRVRIKKVEKYYLSGIIV